ncbi:MAG: aminotransferase class IV [Sedimentisphaerales bacterium]|nr:aminotransferase class IV [Sedimentisphaerales bacterium]
MQIAMVQDKIVPFEDLAPVYLDRGTFFGDGVYEVLRSYDGHIFALEDHLKRFARSLNETNITGVDIDDIRTKVVEAFEKAKIDNAKIYFHITRGSGVRDHTSITNIKPNFFLTVTTLEDATEQKTNGIKVSTFPDWRWKRCDIKSLNLLANVLAKFDAQKKGCSEAILVNDNDQITEGSSSAFFAVIQSKLVTHPLGKDILPSITRKIVLEIARDTDLEVLEKTITPAQAKNADELFIAVTTRDIVPVVEFDGQMTGDGTPGKYTKQLMQKFAEMVKRF